MMNTIIDAAFSRSRVVLLILLFLLVAGSISWINIPKESAPDVAVPIVYVSLNHEGISPDDAERLLVRPMEKELQAVEGLKEMKATASEGHASLILTFYAGHDIKRALDDVREKVDTAKSELPADTDEPIVQEVNFALFPIITVALSGPVPERALIQVARNLKERIETVPTVLKADIGGDREQLMEVVVDPVVLETYGVRFDQVVDLIYNNNKLVAAGAVDTGSGRMVIKVPGVVESLKDIVNLPIKVNGDTVVTLGDVADVRSTFKDPQGFARVGGQPALTLEISKRIGANIIETIEAVQAIVEEERQRWPSTIRVAYMQDQSSQIKTMLSDLTNNVLTAIILVMIIVVAALGLRSAILVGVAIPGAFLTGILVISSMGYTLNMVVLFSLILVVGMLVDGAIVISELAERNRADGMNLRDSFRAASKRMSWPVTASTMTTLAVFLPLLFWPGMVGQFMKYLPITVIICLSASLAMALIFIPVLGASLGGNSTSAIIPHETGKIARSYRKMLALLLKRPGRVLLVAVAALIGTYIVYGNFGRGVEFFPSVEPEFAQVQLHARGDLSIHEKDSLLREVERRIVDMNELKSISSRSFNSVSGTDRAEDVVGVIMLEFIDWEQRRKASEIMEDMRQRTSDIAGVIIEFLKAEDGPSQGKPIQIQVASRDQEKLLAAAAKIKQIMNETPGFIGIEDSLPQPGIEWRLKIDREQAARYGADVSMLGQSVQMLTGGIKVTDYRPDDTDDEVDIRIRFPVVERNLERLNQLTVATVRGQVPISNFVTVEPSPKTGTVTRVDGQRVVVIKADVEEGLLVDNIVGSLKERLLQEEPDPLISVTFKGEDEEQREAAVFLMTAFGIAIFLMTVILVTQFNSLYQAMLVLSAIVFSTAGVLIGLLLTKQPFGIVMVGLGIIALAGIVVNNNIVLIDTYNRIRRDDGLSPVDAALETGSLRLRPVFLTAITTVLGLMPMVFALNVNLIERHIAFGAPSTQWWTQLSSAIAGGLTFATVLTLVLTPCMLVLGEKKWFSLRSFTKPVLLDRAENPGS
ncbi:MAG: efflux RND transporter permease subunit [Arenicellales bacterium]